jgi:hypothetical protein
MTERCFRRRRQENGRSPGINIPSAPSAQHLALHAASSATVNCRKCDKIHVKYQSVIFGAEIVVNLAAFAMLVQCSSLRTRRLPSKQIRSAMPKRNRGTGFLAAE